MEMINMSKEDKKYVAGVPGISGFELPHPVGSTPEYKGLLLETQIKWVEDDESTLLAGIEGCANLGYHVNAVMPDSGLITAKGFALNLYDSASTGNLVILDLHYAAARRGEGSSFSGRDIFLAGQQAIRRGYVAKDKIKFLIATSIEKEFGWSEYAFADGKVYGWKKADEGFANAFANTIDQIIKGSYDNRLN
jgi:hypothetical protein